MIRKKTLMVSAREKGDISFIEAFLSGLKYKRLKVVVNILMVSCESGTFDKI